MNNLENIKAKILSEAEDYKTEALKNARLQREEIIANFKSEGEFGSAKIKAHAKDIISEKETRFLSTMKNEERNAILSVKSRLISECFDKAVDKINSLDDESYLSFLTDLLRRCVADGVSQIILNEKDKSRIGDALLKNAKEIMSELGRNGSITLSENCADISGGFILKYGDIEVNCTTENTIMQNRKKLESEVLKLIMN